MIIFAMRIFACQMKKSPAILKNFICSTVKKEILNLAFKQGILFGKSKQPNKFAASKTCKNVGKGSKTQSGNEF